MPHHEISERTHRLADVQRRTPTRAEEMLWRELRGRRFGGLKFRRQLAVCSYVVDFACFEARLIVELDGPPHGDPEQREHDAHRDNRLRGQGFRILRFSNDLLLGGSGDLVLQAIRRACADHPSSGPRAKPEGQILPQGEKVASGSSAGPRAAP